MEQKFGKNSIDIKALREFCERYERLLQRCPGIVEHLDLQDIASFLNVTPKTISMIRKDITFGSFRTVPGFRSTQGVITMNSFIGSSLI